jgi:pimeloyl-CoA synthetase
MSNFLPVTSREDMNHQVQPKHKKGTPDDASVDTTVVSIFSGQENDSISELSMVPIFSIVKKCMEEIDKQRDEFTTKQQIMDDSISSVTTSVSKLTENIVAVRIDMKEVGEKIEQKLNQIISILATTHTIAPASSPRKVSRVTNGYPVKPASPRKESPSTFGVVVSQPTSIMPP